MKVKKAVWLIPIISVTIVIHGCSDGSDSVTGNNNSVTEFDGYSIKPLGNAILHSKDEKLVVENIGSSGNDGVEIDLKNAQQSWFVGTDNTFKSDNVATNTQSTLHQYAIKDGDEILLESTTISPASAPNENKLEYQWKFNEEIEITNIKLEILNADEVVQSIDNFQGESVLLSTSSTSADYQHVTTGEDATRVCVSIYDIAPGGIIISPLDGSELEANVIKVYYEHNNDQLDGFSRLQLLTKNIARTTINRIATN